jgi:uncharacterized protein YjlB/GNAT superfamily N-acetyltransferase
MTYQLIFEDNPSSADIQVLGDGLMAYAAKQKGFGRPLDFFTFFIRDKDNAIVGGCRGNTLYGCLYIDYLWVSELLRHQGLGTKLVHAALQYGKEKGCTFAAVNTMDWEALEFYQRLGFRIEFERHGFQKDSVFYFLRKDVLDFDKVTIKPRSPHEIIHDLVQPNGFFPNNAHYPLLIYKNINTLILESPQVIQGFLAKNGWIKSWVDSIYDFHHYHSNTHETLVIIDGVCKVQIGGDGGKQYDIAKGDVVILPVGIAHKNMGSSPDFKCIGAYPIDIATDMYYGKAEEHPEVDENIKKVVLPSGDPIYGREGLLFDYWTCSNSQL